MLLGLGGVTALWCLGCQLADGAPTRPLHPPREALVNQQVSDGCTRFALRVVNGVAQVEALYNTNGCQTDQLQLQADSAPTYEAATGTLRVPIVIKNLGTVAVVAPTRIRFNADSSQFLNGQGQVIAGTPNILAANYDTATANGRNGQWRCDTLLAASGQPQVLAPGATSRRRWLEFTGTSWNQTVRIKLPTAGTQVGSIGLIPPDSFPRALLTDTNFVVPPQLADAPVAKNLLLVLFTADATLAQRQYAISLVGGEVVGGIRLSADGDGEYIIRVPTHPQAAYVFSARQTLLSLSFVAHATPVSGFNMRAQHRRPDDGVGFKRSDWRITRLSSDSRKTWGQAGLAGAATPGRGIEAAFSRLGTPASHRVVNSHS